MRQRSEKHGQSGFTILEMLIALSVMLVVGAAVFSLMRDSMKVASTTYELTDAQEGLRTAQEYINRDLINAGDGLQSINNIRVTSLFAAGFLTVNPILVAGNPAMTDLGIITSDNNTPANTLVLGTNPVTTVRSNPILNDRLSILEMDATFVPISLNPGSISADGSDVAIAAADVGRFQLGEIYFISSVNGATFATITNITNAPSLTFAAGDAFGLNAPGNGGPINVVSAGGTVSASLMRIKIIHYYVSSTGTLRRRVFGVSGGGFTDSLIAENISSLQFRYLLSLRDAAGNVVQPETQLATSQQQLAINQVEVSVTTETNRVIQNNNRERLTMTTSTSVRNMQFRGALQPTAGN